MARCACSAAPPKLSGSKLLPVVTMLDHDHGQLADHVLCFATSDQRHDAVERRSGDDHHYRDLHADAAGEPLPSPSRWHPFILPPHCRRAAPCVDAGGELVAAVTQGFQQAEPPRVAELVAKAADEHVDRTVERSAALPCVWSRK